MRLLLSVGILGGVSISALAGVEIARAHYANCVKVSDVCVAAVGLIVWTGLSVSIFLLAAIPVGLILWRRFLDRVNRPQ